MDLSELIFNRLEKSEVRYDKKSFEESTGRIHPKYKVLISRYLEACVFHKFQSDRSSCSGKFRVCIAQGDYVEKKSEHLKHAFSYIDASKPDILDKEQIIKKINDPSNKFEHIGRLSEGKLAEIIRLLKAARKFSGFSPNRNSLIEKAEECLVKETLERLKKI